MSNLDEKLLGLVFSMRNAVNDIEPDKPILLWVKDIKQVFDDAGYEIVPDGTIPTFKSYLKQVMTGQQWYDRFASEYKQLRQDDDTYEKLTERMIEAAKRAARLIP